MFEELKRLSPNAINEINEKNNEEIVNKEIYFDALNYADIFIDFNNFWNLEYAEYRIKEFINLCKISGHCIKVFIHYKLVSNESQEKWKNRRETEVRDSKKIPMISLGTILGNIFHQFGVEVHYSLERDKADTVASYAHMYSGIILSKARDFISYMDPKFVVCNHFESKDNNEGIKLIKRISNYQVPISNQKEILNILPKTFKIQEVKDYFLFTIDDQYIYKRGYSSSLMKYFGNDHITIKPLRQALYYHLGIDKPILEVFPNWNKLKDDFEWYEAKTEAEGELKDLLYDPDKAYDFFFRDIVKPTNLEILEWNKHLFNMNIIVCELCSVAMNKPLLSILKNSRNYSNREGDFDVTKINLKLNSKYFTDKPLLNFNCLKCEGSFTITENEKLFYENKGIELPKKCKECREKNKLLGQKQYRDDSKNVTDESTLTVTCRQCVEFFTITENEKQFYESKGFTLPNKCKECRKKNKMMGKNQIKEDKDIINLDS